MPKFKLGRRFLLNILSGQFSLCDEECCGTEPPRCFRASKYRLCFPESGCFFNQEIWVALRTDPLTGQCIPGFGTIRYNGLCWSLVPGQPPLGTDINDLPNGTTVVQPLLVEEVQEGCVLGVCPDPTLYVPTEPCGCNDPQPTRAVYVCAASVPTCITGQITVPDTGPGGGSRPYCFTARPGPGLRRENISDPTAYFAPTITGGPINNCCGCCGSLNGSCQDNEFQLSCLCSGSTPIPGTLCGPARRFCCSPTGTQRTTVNFFYTNSSNQSVSGNYVRITRYADVGGGFIAPVSDELTGSWTVNDPFANPQTRTGAYGFGPNDVTAAHVYVGCLINKFDTDIARAVIQGPSAFGFGCDIIAGRPDTGCGCIFTINDHRRSFAQVSTCAVENSAGDFICSISGSALSEWLSDGPCSGGCGPSKTVPIRPGTGIPVQPDPIPNTALTGNPEDTF